MHARRAADEDTGGVSSRQVRTFSERACGCGVHRHPSKTRPTTRTNQSNSGWRACRMPPCRVPLPPQRHGNGRPESQVTADGTTRQEHQTPPHGDHHARTSKADAATPLPCPSLPLRAVGVGGWRKGRVGPGGGGWFRGPGDFSRPLLALVSFGSHCSVLGGLTLNLSLS